MSETRMRRFHGLTCDNRKCPEPVGAGRGDDHFLAKGAVIA